MTGLGRAIARRPRAPRQMERRWRSDDGPALRTRGPTNTEIAAQLSLALGTNLLVRGSTAVPDRVE